MGKIIPIINITAGVVSVLIGIALCFTIVLIIIGIPMFIFGAWNITKGINQLKKEE